MLKYLFLSTFCISITLAALTCSDPKETIITTHESKNPCVYSKNNAKYVGVGFNLARKTAQNDLTAVGANYNSIISNQSCLQDNQIAQLLANDLTKTLQLTKGAIPSFDNLPACAQNVLLDLAFGDAANNGQTIFSDPAWKSILNLLTAKNYKGAGDAIKALKKCSTDWKLKCTDDVALIYSLARVSRLWRAQEK